MTRAPRLRFLLAPMLLLPLAVLAKAWNGIEPGVSHRDEVVKRFGPPNKTLTVSGKEVLAYTDATAIKGTSLTELVPFSDAAMSAYLILVLCRSVNELRA